MMFIVLNMTIIIKLAQMKIINMNTYIDAAFVVTLWIMMVQNLMERLGNSKLTFLKNTKTQ